MYFPYLFDKRSELLAVREMAGAFGSPQKIIPLIEPVSAAAGLVRLHAALKNVGDFGYVIENPHQLKLSDRGALNTWRQVTTSLFADRDVFRPVWKEREDTTAADIAAFVAKHRGRPVGVVITTGHLSVADIRAALGRSDSIVFMTNGADRVALLAVLGASKVVEVNDRFPAQRINADYSGEEWFSRDHLDYASVHGYVGFSDYTVVPPAPSKGGGAPGAVAIHLTYKAGDGSTWVQHFVSDEIDRSAGTVNSKLLEAVDHITAEVSAHPRKFDSSPALLDYLARGGRREATSLGNNKKLQIAHHLYVVARRLGI